MLSDEEKEIFKNLKEYMQNNINNGYHKFVYNDLGWDFKGIDCINAIDKVLNQSKEIEELKAINKKLDARKYMYNAETGEVTAIPIDNNYISKDKIKAKIEEIEKRRLQDGECELALHGFQREAKLEVLQSLLNEEE